MTPRFEMTTRAQSAEAKVADLEGERNRLAKSADFWKGDATLAHQRAQAAEAENARLRAAAAPFVLLGRNLPEHWRQDVPLKAQSNIPGNMPTVGEYRALARALLHEGEK